MAKKTSFIGTFGGNPKTRMSNVLSGDRLGGRKYGNPSLVSRGSPYNTLKPAGFSVKAPKDQSRMVKDIPAAIDIRGYLGDERTGIRKPTTSFAAGLKAKAAAKKVTPAAVVRTTTDMKTSPAKAKAPTRMAVNPFTGNTLGFTTGKTTGSTSSKSGIATRTPMTTNQRMTRAAMEKGGVSGPRKTADGKNASYGFGGSKSGKKK